MTESGQPDSREFHQKAYDLFEAAVRLPENRRTEFIEQETNDLHLRQEVLRLLEHDLGTLPGADRDLERYLAPGAQIGEFRILSLLGLGGMAEVYLAEQRTPLKREVALKVIRADLHSESIISRFRFEERILAQMDHPGIAKVFDTGVSDDGRPYFVMEYVPGEPISEYCDMHKLSFRERLEIFCNVCRAVQHAHQKGVIHRDLKPANVLVHEVDGQAHPKIIDFGIARAMEDPGVHRSQFTAQGVLIGTPEYMSPEQTRGELVDTRADVYALGVVLYEILCGARPFQLSGPMHDDSEKLLRMIREEDPSPPSVQITDERCDQIVNGVSTRSLMRRLQGELDWIVLKSLAKLPGERYQSPGALEADIRRHLDGDVVLARPPTTRYRLRKFLARHRLLVGSAVAITLLVIVFTITLAWQFTVAKSAESRAEREAKTAQDRLHSMTQLADDILVNVYDQIGETPGLLEAKATLARSLSRHLQAMEGDEAPEPELATSLGRSYLVLSRLQADPRSQSLGDNIAGLENVENAVRLLEIGSDTYALLEARVLQANLLQSHGRLVEACEILEVCVRSASGQSYAAQEYLARAHMLLGEMCWELGRYEYGVNHIRLAAAQYSTLEHAEAPLSLSLQSLAEMGGEGESMALADSAVAIARAGRGRTPGNLAVERAYAHALTTRGSLRLDGDRIDEALEDFEASLEIWELLSRNDPGDSRSRNYAARNHHRIGRGLTRRGDNEEAEAHHLAGARIRREVRDSDGKPTWGPGEEATS